MPPTPADPHHPRVPTHHRVAALAVGTWLNLTLAIINGLMTILVTRTHGVAAGTLLAGGTQASSIIGAALVLTLRHRSARTQLLTLAALSVGTGVCIGLVRHNLLLLIVLMAAALGAAWAGWSTARGALLAPDGNPTWVARGGTGVALGQASGALLLSVLLATTDVTTSALVTPLLIGLAASWLLPLLVAAATANSTAATEHRPVLEAVRTAGSPTRPWRNWYVTTLVVAPAMLMAAPWLVDNAGESWVPAVQITGVATAVVLPRLVKHLTFRHALTIAVAAAASWTTLLIIPPTEAMAAGMVAIVIVLAGRLAAGAASINMTAVMLKGAQEQDRPLCSMLASAIRAGTGALLGMVTAAAPVALTAAATAAGTGLWTTSTAAEQTSDI